MGTPDIKMLLFTEEGNKSLYKTRQSANWKAYWLHLSTYSSLSGKSREI